MRFSHVRSHQPHETTVAVGMSGGVDSSVAAYLLKKSGYRIFGIFMKNWDDSREDNDCQAARDYEDVARVCDQLEIPYYSVDFTEDYWEKVFLEFLEGYKEGNTPNPDILCNREIKFNVFLKHAKELGADFLATGHYAQLGGTAEFPELLRGVDSGKDQTYFLHAVEGKILKDVLFPIGHLQKREVRELAEEAGLSTSTKKDSTGICFIGERNFRPFLKNFLSARPGPFKTLDGKVVGEHQGSIYYTLGQRRGLGLGGPGGRWFVVRKNVSQNEVFVVQGADHPDLYSDELEASELTWVGEVPTQPFECTAKNRYRQPDQHCRVTPLEGGRVRVEFAQPQRALTPLQSVVFYDEQRCLGGGLIQRLGPSWFEQGKRLEPEQIQLGSPA